MTRGRILALLPFLLGAGTIAAHAMGGHDEGAAPSLLGFAWIFGVIATCAVAASHRADAVAERLGEPIGTVVLTLSVIVIEVAVVAAMMIADKGEPTVARDTMFATLMIILNGLVGVALLAGGMRRHEQTFNLQTSASYLSLLIPLAAITLVLPRMTITEPGGFMTRRMEVFVAFACVAVYGAFLWMQTSSHRGFFSHPGGQGDGAHGHGEHGHADHGHGDHGHAQHGTGGHGHAVPAAPQRPMWVDILALVVLLGMVVLMAESLGSATVRILEVNGLPRALAGVLVASLILGPEGVAAIQAARSESMQRTMNILLGSALSTIGLTVPVVLALGLIRGQRVELGLEPPEITLLACTVLVSVVNFTHGRTNRMQGLVHLCLFVAYIALIFDVPSGSQG
jgi:Ca2+:H+ antiporter